MCGTSLGPDTDLLPGKLKPRLLKVCLQITFKTTVFVPPLVSRSLSYLERLLVPQTDRHTHRYFLGGNQVVIITFAVKYDWFKFKFFKKLLLKA